MRKENVIRGRILKEKAQMVRVNVPLTIDGKDFARSTQKEIVAHRKSEKVCSQHTKGEYMQITVIRKSDNSVITRIFEDDEGIKEITDDDYEVLIEKDSN